MAIRFDGWGRLPLRALHERIAELQTTAAPDGPPPTLAEALQAIGGQRNTTVLLVLDAFERHLAEPAHRLDIEAFDRELARVPLRRVGAGARADGGRRGRARIARPLPAVARDMSVPTCCGCPATRPMPPRRGATPTSTRRSASTTLRCPATMRIGRSIWCSTTHRSAERAVPTPAATAALAPQRLHTRRCSRLRQPRPARCGAPPRQTPSPRTPNAALRRHPLARDPRGVQSRRGGPHGSPSPRWPRGGGCRPHPPPAGRRSSGLALLMAGLIAAAWLAARWILDGQRIDPAPRAPAQASTRAPPAGRRLSEPPPAAPAAPPAPLAAHPPHPPSHRPLPPPTPRPRSIGSPTRCRSTPTLRR